MTGAARQPKWRRDKKRFECKAEMSAARHFDEVDYFREVGLLEELRVTLELAEVAADGSRFAILNTFSAGTGRCQRA
jgi:hypothetical protein